MQRRLVITADGGFRRGKPSDLKGIVDEAVAQTPVDHVSAYSLIVEEGTRMALKVRRGELPMPDDDELADKYLVAEEYLAAQGFANYELEWWHYTLSPEPQPQLMYNVPVR